MNVKHNLVWQIQQVTQANRVKEWLVLGKGPTADKLATIDTAQYHIFSLNHACQIIEPDIAHFADIEACYSCSQVLLDYLTNGTKTRLALPWRPHVNCVASKHTLRSGPITAEVATLFQPVANYDNADRLVSYNATTSRLPPEKGLPALTLRYFSATAAFAALVRAGIKQIFSLGVDGGTQYAQAFDQRDRLKNGRASFDIQHGELTKIMLGHRVAWIKL